MTKEFAGETHHFCSEHCLQALEANPDRYVRERSTAERAPVARVHY